MIDKRRIVALASTATLVAAVLAGALSTNALADEVKGKWRFDLQVGGFSPGGEIASKAGNATTLVTLEDEIVVEDPRPDSTALNTTDGSGGPRIEFHASYGVAAFKRSELILDVGVGYQRSTIEDLELSHSFDSTDSTTSGLGGYASAGCETLLANAPGNTVLETQLAGCVWFSERLRQIAPGPLGVPTRSEAPDSAAAGAPSLTQFQTELVEVGDVTSIPVTIDALWRFRPTKRFNPYIGAGVGYLVVDFDESNRFRQVADQLAGSRVAYVTGPASSDALGNRDLDGVNIEATDADGDGTDEIRALALGHSLQRPSVEAPSSFFGQLRGGVEFQFARRWSFFADAKFSWAAKDIYIKADGLEQFGAATPAINEFDPAPDGQTDPQTFPIGGRPAYIIQGGLRQPGYDPVTGDLVSTGENGQPGEYYINGGRLKHGGWAFMTGIRFTL